MRQHERIALIYGATGTGKSTAARALLRGRQHVIAIDPMGEYGGKGWSSVTTRRGVQDAVARQIAAGRPIRVAYQCGGAYATEAPWLAQGVWALQRAWREGRARITLVMEEANAYYPAQAMQSGQARIFDELVLRGRHRGIDIVAVTQRPAGVSMSLRGNAGEIWAFYMPAKRDRQSTEEKAENAAAIIKALPKYQCLRIRLQSLELWKTTKNGKLTPATKAESAKFGLAAAAA